MGQNHTMPRRPSGLSVAAAALVMRPIRPPTGGDDSKLSRRCLAAGATAVAMMLAAPALARGSTSPEDQSAWKEDDATAAVRAAVRTGKNVELDPSKRYKITSPITPADGQALVGGGLMPVGNFDAITIGPSRGVMIDLIMHCGGQTGGYALTCAGAERVLVRKLFLRESGYNVVHIRRSNSISISELHAIELRGHVGVRWFGDDRERSDILNIDDAVVAFADSAKGAIGLDWCGNCHSLHVDNFHAVGKPGPHSPLRHGLLVRNPVGAATSPQIGRLDSFASDYSQSHGLCFEAGDDIDISKVYQNGSREGSGVFVSRALAAYAVRIHGGKTIGNALYGIHAESSVSVRDTLAYANRLGNSHGFVTGNLLSR